MKMTIRKPNGKRAESKHLLSQKISMSLETKVGCHKYLTLPEYKSPFSGYAAKFESVVNQQQLQLVFHQCKIYFNKFSILWIISAGVAIGYQ